MRNAWVVIAAVACLAGIPSAHAAGPSSTPTTSPTHRSSTGRFQQGSQQGSQQQQPGMQQGQQGSQQQGQQQGAQGANRSYEATKHIAVINAGLRDAEMNARMLADISSDSRSYDQMHGQIFYRNIQQSISEAEEHLSHLQPLASTQNEKNQLQQLSKNLSDAKSMLQPMQSQLSDPQKVNSAATKLEKQFSNSMRPLRQVAQEMNSKVKIG
ncbi:MAG TPA: hypothetical protein VN033_14210 [Vulgatibacter sp.]|nr:hypothetical protein [Vulgatibacter sp.]